MIKKLVIYIILGVKNPGCWLRGDGMWRCQSCPVRGAGWRPSVPQRKSAGSTGSREQRDGWAFLTVHLPDTRAYVPKVCFSLEKNM